MKRTYYLLLLLFLATGTLLQGQTTISGTVSDIKKQPLPGVNVYIKDSYDGASTDANGKYSFSASDNGELILVVSLIGFEQQELKINAQGQPLTMNITLKETFNELKVVTISAGTIEASDENKTTVLKPLDIVTTAGAQGDIVGALKTLPGAQQVGESEGLFVRGGTGAETKTIIDGMIVNKPFFSAPPDLASRGRFSPFLFKGTVFSTGGYSAQYGQGMSSVIALETQDLPNESSATVGVSSVGLSGGYNHLWKEKGMSAGFDVNYANLLPYFNLVPQTVEYTRAPQFSGGSMNFRKKTSSSGILKFYGYINLSDLGIRTPSIDSTNGFKNLFELNNNDVYTILTYRERIGEKWLVNTGVSYATNTDNITTSYDTLKSQSDLSQGRIVFSRGVGKLSMLRIGAEYQYGFDAFKNRFFKRSIYENFSAGFLEADIYLSTKLVWRAGLRAEYSTLMAKAALAPRTSISYKLGEKSNLSVAYGDFYQKPEREYLFYDDIPGYNKASHYILNYQFVDDLHTLRAEIYYKSYDHLTRINPDTSNRGSGYAQGLDVFWRDKKTIKGVDYWISYSYLDTKRQFKNYPSKVTPDFAATHTASLVFKKFFTKLMLSTGFTYTVASGRPYYNPNNPEFMSDRTIPYNALGVNAAYLRQIGKCFAVLAVSVTNVIGNEQIYGYRYSYNGQNRQAVGPAAPRFFFVGLFLSFGTDRSKEIIDNNN